MLHTKVLFQHETLTTNIKQLHFSDSNEGKLVDVSKLLVKEANYIPKFIHAYSVSVTTFECILTTTFCYYLQIT
jgi:hypothetical protein